MMGIDPVEKHGKEENVGMYGMSFFSEGTMKTKVK